MPTTSAFVLTSPATQRQCLGVTEALVQASMYMDTETADPKRDVMESETEDEEVKINCLGGFRGVEDSDMNTSDDDESIEGEADEESNPEKNQGVVNFICKRVPVENTLALIRPKAFTPTRPGLSPLEEVAEQEDTSDNSSCSSGSSVGARGIPLSFGTPSALSEASCGDHEELNDDELECFASDDESMSSASSTSSEEGDDLPDSESPQKSSARSVSSDEEVEPDTDTAEDQNDDELSDILQSLGEDRLSTEPEELDSSERFIGVMEDREDLITIPKTKRVLSFNTLAALNMEARGVKGDSPKRRKPTDSYWEQSSLMSSFSLGPPAAMNSLNMRRESPVISSSDEEEELDRQLGAELQEQSRGENKTPVPLLTPPGSPLTVHLDGDTTTVCEWPSNLTVDSAMAAATELRPMSPASLEDLERKDYQRKLEPEASALTPLLRGINVGD